MTYADVLRQQAGEEQASIGRAGELEAKQADIRAQGLAQQAAFEQATIRDRQMAEMKRREDLAQRESALEQERQEIAKTKIDSHQWYNNLSDGKKNLMMIGGFLGGVLSVSTGSGHNDFTEWMDEQARQNMEAQKAMLANRQEALGHGESMYSKLLQRYGDERVADEMYASAMYTSIGHAAAAQAAQFDAPKAKENAQMMAIQAGQRANAALQAAALASQESALRKQQVGIQAYEAHTGRMNAETNARNQEAEAEARKAAAESKAAGKQFPFRGNDGQIMGFATSEKEQDEARQTVIAKGKLDSLYKRGRELFAGGWAPRGTEARARQDAWNQDWAMARRHASGDHSAPNKDDQARWGLDTSATITNQNMAVLDEAYNIARDNGAAVLRSSGVPDDVLKEQGYMAPPPAPTPGKTDKVLYWDEGSQSYNSEGRGVPLSEEQSAHVKADPTKVIEGGPATNGVWYDPETKTYNVRGVGTRLSPDAEAQVRANPSFKIERGPAPDAAEARWQEKSMQGQGMPGTNEDSEDWALVDPKYRPKGWKPKPKAKAKR